MLSNCIFFCKKGVSVDVGFVLKEKKDIGDTSQSFLGLFIHEYSLKLSKHISLLVWLIYLLIDASTSAHCMHEACIGLRWWHKTLAPNLTSKYISFHLRIFNPHPTKWGPMRPHFIINICHSSHGWRMCSRFKEFVLMCKPPWMQILLLYYIWIWKCWDHFSIGVQIDPSKKALAMTVTTKIKTNEQNPTSIKTNTFMHLILPLIFKKSVVTIIMNLWWGPNRSV